MAVADSCLLTTQLPCMMLDFSFLVCFSWLRISSSGKSLVAGEKIKLRSKMK
jgi:hypothetical protein